MAPTKTEGAPDGKTDQVQQAAELQIQKEAEGKWAAERAQIIARFKAQRSDLSQEVVSDEKLYGLGKKALREIFVDNEKEVNGTFEGTFNPAKNEQFKIALGLKHFVPAQYKYIKITTANGGEIYGTRKGEVKDDEDAKSMQAKREGAFYDEDGNYIPIWPGDHFKASVEALRKEASATPPAAPAQAPAQATAATEAQKAPDAPAPVVSRELTPQLSEAVPPSAFRLVGDSLSVGTMGAGVINTAHIPTSERAYSINSATKRYLAENNLPIPKGNLMSFDTFNQLDPTIQKGLRKTGIFPAKIGDAVGGAMTGQMLARLRKSIGSMQAEGVKRIAVFGGVNNLASGNTPELIIKELGDMYKLARDAGIKVVACTVPSWNTNKWVEKEQVKFCQKHNLTPQLLDERTATVNNWIRAQAASGAIDGVVDLAEQLGRYDTTEPGLRRGDSIHFQSYKKMAAAIAQGVNIGTPPPLVA